MVGPTLVWFPDRVKALRALRKAELYPSTIHGEVEAVRAALEQSFSAQKAGELAEFLAGLSRKQLSSANESFKISKKRELWDKDRDAALKILRSAGLTPFQISGNQEKVEEILTREKFPKRQIKRVAKFLAGCTNQSLGTRSHLLKCTQQPEEWSYERDVALDLLRKAKFGTKRIKQDQEAVVEILRKDKRTAEQAEDLFKFLSAKSNSKLSARAKELLSPALREYWSADEVRAWRLLRDRGVTPKKLKDSPSEAVAALVAARFGRDKAEKVVPLLCKKPDERLSLKYSKPSVKWNEAKREALRKLRESGLSVVKILKSKRENLRVLKSAGYEASKAQKLVEFLMARSVNALGNQCTIIGCANAQRSERIKAGIKRGAMSDEQHDEFVRFVLERRLEKPTDVIAEEWNQQGEGVESYPVVVASRVERLLYKLKKKPTRSQVRQMPIVRERIREGLRLARERKASDSKPRKGKTQPKKRG